MGLITLDPMQKAWKGGWIDRFQMLAEASGRYGTADYTLFVLERDLMSQMYWICGYRRGVDRYSVGGVSGGSWTDFSCVEPPGEDLAFTRLGTLAARFNAICLIYGFDLEHRQWVLRQLREGTCPGK